MRSYHPVHDLSSVVGQLSSESLSLKLEITVLLMVDT